MSGNGESTVTRTVRPGEIWLIEQSPERGLAPLDRAALHDANVVLYDPALTALVAVNLPLGSYAEPLAPRPQPARSAAVSQRARRFAEDGWSVVQLVAGRPDGGERVRLAAAAPGSAANSAELGPARVFTANGLAG